MYDKSLVKPRIRTIADTNMARLKQEWFSGNHSVCTWQDYIDLAQDWFLGSKLVDLQGIEQFPCVDVTCGNTHYIESFVLKYGWQGFQILRNEYAYYKLMGKHGVSLDQLEANKPMIVTIPDFFTGGVRSEWQDLLAIAEQKNIDLHLDLAWIVMARDIEIDLAHPCIKSFAISMSKLHLNWNRVGLRWSRQRTMDSITILNHYYKADINTNIFSCGAYHMQRLDRDYVWNRYGDLNQDICKQLGLTQTKFVHCVNPSDHGLECITDLLLEHAG
tara:strand:- start:1736 stop:2557 length:822 start_codon:yes stop_codon:yes gene_type:complete